MNVKVNIIYTRCIPLSDHRAKFDDYDFKSLREIACEGQTQTHTYTASSMLTVKILSLRKQKTDRNTMKYYVHYIYYYTFGE